MDLDRAAQLRDRAKVKIINIINVIKIIIIIIVACIDKWVKSKFDIVTPPELLSGPIQDI